MIKSSAFSTSPQHQQQPNNRPPLLVSPVERDARDLGTVSYPTFIATLAFLPLWSVTVLPLSVTYQVGKALVKKVIPSGSNKQEKEKRFVLDSGYRVDPSTILPRKDRKYDIIVLGVTGFTGSLAARYLAKQYATSSAEQKKVVRWAVAGRNADKLKATMERLANELNMPDLVSSVDRLVVDTSIPATVCKLAQQTRVIATTVGPYALYGSAVVEACAKCGTHYADITGEVDWVRNMICQWQTTAQETGAKLIPFCGHDSIPWDLCTMKLQEAIQSVDKDEDLVAVKFWDQLKGGAPGGTLQTVYSSIDGTTMPTPSNCEFDPLLRLPDGSKSTNVLRKDYPVMKISPSTSPWDNNMFLSKPSKRWVGLFVMAPVNAQVVRWSHSLRQSPGSGNKILSYYEAAIHPDFKTAFTSALGVVVLGSLLLNPLTGYIMREYVLPKSGQGPSMTDMEKNHFLCVYGQGIGSKGSCVESVMYLDKDAGCMETARMLVESGLTMALQEDELANKAGGLWSPATGLGDVLFNRLVQTGTHFEMQTIPSKVADFEVRTKNE